jgi:PAS domain-containing protein
VKPDLLGRLLTTSRRTALFTAAAIILAIALSDWLAVPNSSVGLLYFFPILIVSPHLSWFEIAVLGLLCSVLREQAGPLAWSEGLAPRLLTAFATYLVTGLLMRQMERHRKIATLRAHRLTEEVQRRESSEQQLRGLIEGMPAAILTLDPGGKVLLANQAAYELLG